ncbi:Diphthine--ammonia ligase [Paramyrothecium foliicola]|nr:Diphthine--ammonia ligase [Paramyrothecium foliicola]
MSSERLNVIALISGGKDSFFSLLHCIHHGHRVVALANLHPADSDGSDAAARDVQVIEPGSDGEDVGDGPAAVPGRGGAASAASAPLQDLNSFMYQTVGHEVVPLYAAATGLPLYRQPIVGEAVRHARDYDYATSIQSSGVSSAPDETESMLSLLQAVKARHPEANAVCAGAILSTYQRTRVESVALRLGLVPLAYLWKYPILPHPTSHEVASPKDDAQLLRDMAGVGLEARIIKVASAGLDEGHLWERVTGDAGASKVKRALSKFGAADGAALGEGGEFETIVLDGPTHLFKKRIIVPDEGKTVVREGGGSNWLMIRGAHLKEKTTADDEDDVNVVPQTPHLLDPPFETLLDDMKDPDGSRKLHKIDRSSLLGRASSLSPTPLDLFSWTFSAESSEHNGTIEAETLCVVHKIRERLSTASLEASDITTVVIILRDMSAFPKINGEYGKLFTRPNPPSRVTISCGELLPEGSNICVYLTAPANSKTGDRDGLHVQSRSYWAPANIGPYSQAIDVPVVSQGKPTRLRLVSIAGQIPLIPASMELPTPSDTALQTEVVLSLQHLWRIGSEMGVQCWTSAVAYFARAPSEADMQRSAALASRSWAQIHAAPSEDEDDAEESVDPWDLKYNPQYASLGSAGKRTASGPIPDWSAFTLAQQNETGSCIPPLFAVEVESLPRQSAVEWHAHAGISGMDASSIEFVSGEELGTAGWRACHMIVRATDSIFMHTTVSCILPASSAAASWESLTEAMAKAYAQSLRNVNIGKLGTTLVGAPYLAYVDTVRLPSPWSQASSPGTDLSFAVIPCRSIWSSEGERVGLIGVYRTTLTVANSI